MTVSRWTRCLTPLAIALLAVHCGSSTDTPTGPTPTPSTTTPPPPVQPAYSVADFVANVGASDGTIATRHTTSAPPANGGPGVAPTANQSAINGGSSVVRLRAPASFQTVYVFIGGVAGNVGGHWQVRLASPTTDVAITVTFARTIRAGSFDVVYAVASGSGAVGAYSAVPTRVIEGASTGEVQVSASWDARSDVDLHVVDPGGEEIYYGNGVSRSGGRLDLDSNADCAIDNKNNENIRWTTAPAGSYVVRLDYYSSCGVAQTNYVVTVNNGGTTQTFRGTFTGPGDFGGQGSGRTITTFSRGSTTSSIAGAHEFLLSRLPALFVPSLTKIGRFGPLDGPARSTSGSSAATLTPERYQRLQTMVEEAANQPTPERRSFSPPHVGTTGRSWRRL